MSDLIEKEHVVVSDRGDFEHREHIVEDLSATRRQKVYRVTEFIWLAVGILEGLVGIRIFLKLIAANPANPFAAMVYRITALFLWPFFGLTVNPAADGFVLEITSIVGMLVYALLGWLVVQVLWLVFYQWSTRRVSTYERDEVRPSRPA